MRIISELTETAYPDHRANVGIGSQADPSGVTYRITVRDLDVAWSIGVYEHEHTHMQRVRINLDLEAVPLEDWEADDYDTVPCYASISEKIQEMARDGHIKLVETLASRIADLCLEDQRVLCAKVCVEKPEALASAASVGVELTRCRKA
jgi:dihydroneopterin aldolase